MLYRREIHRVETYPVGKKKKKKVDVEFYEGEGGEGEEEAQRARAVCQARLMHIQEVGGR